MSVTSLSPYFNQDLVEINFNLLIETLQLPLQFTTLNPNFELLMGKTGISNHNVTVPFKMEDIYAKNGVLHIIENMIIPKPLNKVRM